MKEQSGTPLASLPRPQPQVEWNELGYSSWDTQTSQNLKRPLEATLLENTFLTSPCMPHYDNGTVEMNIHLKPQLGNNTRSRLWIPQQEESVAKRALLQQKNATLPKVNRKGHLAGSGSCSVSIIPQNDQHFLTELDQHSFEIHNPLSPDIFKLEPEVLSDPVNPQSQNWSSSVVGIPQSDSATVNGLIPLQDTDEWMVHSSCQQGLQEHRILRSEAVLRNLSAKSNNPGEIWGNTSVDVSSASATMVEPSNSSAILDEFCTLQDKDFQKLSDCIVSNFSMSQDVQSQITSASLAESHVFSVQDLAIDAGGASSSHADFNECSFLQNNSRPRVASKAPPRRTYTKVQRAGSVGRSIDVTAFKNYEELIHAIESMFGLEGLLNDDTRGRDSEWKLVYVDYENDVLLVGDDPWGEFVNCVRCIRILSPTELKKMSKEGMQLLNSGALQRINGHLH
ncbi:hypothetical protein HN51_052033 [Arachis hypogaea]|uniref:Auxin-induced protein n=1 Tax=Arachis hypogaea TaxID=3818 RepID=A0A445CCB9_ARAHY|nr:auxin response factor 12 [Arachis ipaensis]XP_025667301.1 auxin response factor 12 [Arachis hypogaea]QHN93302.1 Auxin response factor [Arachis hypogaea]RYR48592.1 hypothetical protein Ahy_A07g034628 [Arachis hypogaea]